MTDTPAVKHRMSPLEWTGVAAGVVALVASFLPWFTVTGELLDERRSLGLQTYLTAWGTNFLGWFPAVLLAAVSVLIISQLVGKTAPILVSLWVTLAFLATVMILLRWITVPEAIYAGLGLYLGLAAALVSGIAGLVVFRSRQLTAQPEE